MQKREPQRTCIACRKKGKKEDFLKIVLNKSGEIFVERTKRLDGRGAYICKNLSCALQAKKSKALNRVFKTNVPIEIYEELINEFEPKQN